ncbi:MAG: ThiF family adenylyltransferase [Chitinophagales bacterium]
MELKNFSRIEGAVDTQLLRNTHILGVGAGGAYCLYDSLARSGIGQLTVFDFDDVEEVNLVRQGYETDQIGQLKVDALGNHLKKVNQGTQYKGVVKNFLQMSDTELDETFGKADLLLFLTDSFKAQAYGNVLALKYQKPAIWAGFYEKSQCAEIVFTIPGVTPACFRCAVSPRYKAQEESVGGIAVSSNCNTIFHSQLLDAYVGMIALAILHNNTEGFEYSNWFGKHWNRNLIQLKVNPAYGNEQGSLFQRVFEPTEGRCPNFNAIWQKIEEERPPKYEHCPDCGGTGDLRHSKSFANQKN